MKGKLYVVRCGRSYCLQIQLSMCFVQDQTMRPTNTLLCCLCHMAGWARVLVRYDQGHSVQHLSLNCTFHVFHSPVPLPYFFPFEEGYALCTVLIISNLFLESQLNMFKL